MPHPVVRSTNSASRRSSSVISAAQSCRRRRASAGIAYRAPLDFSFLSTSFRPADRQARHKSSPGDIPACYLISNSSPTLMFSLWAPVSVSPRTRNLSRPAHVNRSRTDCQRNDDYRSNNEHDLTLGSLIDISLPVEIAAEHGDIVTFLARVGRNRSSCPIRKRGARRWGDCKSRNVQC